MKTLSLLLIIAASAAVAEESLPGAKKIFYDPTSDVEIKDIGPGAAAKPRPRPAHPDGSSDVMNHGKTATGLMYSIELQTPDGKMAIVPSSHIFHNGDRIRLHIKSNVDGKLVVMQSEDQGPYRLLFPPDPNTDNRVKKMADNVFPKRFFRFNEKPGDLKLMLMLTADGATPNMIAVTAPVQVTGPGTAQPPAAPVQQAPPSAPQAAPPAQPTAPVRASTPAPGGNSDLRAQYDAQVRAEYDKLKGSKALVMEDDVTSPEPSTTVVSVPWRDSNITPGVVVVEVRLKQQA